MNAAVKTPEFHTLQIAARHPDGILLYRGPFMRDGSVPNGPLAWAAELVAAGHLEPIEDGPEGRPQWRITPEGRDALEEG